MSIPEGFSRRHIGPGEGECTEMLRALGCSSLEDLVEQAVPAAIQLGKELSLPEAESEDGALAELRGVMRENVLVKNCLGQGYSGTITPPVILRNVLENPGWYTAYTPYQAEIAQGRLEALLNFQTMVTDLTGLDIANASLLDEGTAAAEAMTMAQASNAKGTVFFADQNCHPQTIAVLRTRAESVGVQLVVDDWKGYTPPGERQLIGALVQYPDTLGAIKDYSDFSEKVHEVGGLLVVAADPLALVLLKEPASFGADLCVGSTQRFGVPMGFGGPHAAYIACRDALKRKLPGRLVGVSVDRSGKPGLRLALQTREQHIRRDKATSNICTAQVLLAVMASMYAVYHGPDGLRKIARGVQQKTNALAAALKGASVGLINETWFDTLTVQVDSADAAVEKALQAGYNIRKVSEKLVGVSFDETLSLIHISEPTRPY